MEDALRHGNRLIVMKNGQIIQDQTAEVKIVKHETGKIIINCLIRDCI